MAEDAARIADVQKKIERERIMLDATIRARQAHDNPQAQARADNQIREGQRGLQYLENSLRELQTRQRMGGMNLNQNGAPAPPRHGQSSSYHGPPQSGQQRQSYADNRSSYGDPKHGGYSNIHVDQGMPARAPFGPTTPGSPTSKPRPNYSKLGTVPSDGPPHH